MQFALFNNNNSRNKTKMNICEICIACTSVRYGVQRKKFKVRAHYFKLNVNSMYHSRHESWLHYYYCYYDIRMHKNGIRRCCIYGRAQPTAPIHIIIYALQSEVKRIQIVRWDSCWWGVWHTKIGQKYTLMTSSSVSVWFLACAYDSCAPQLHNAPKIYCVRVET